MIFETRVHPNGAPLLSPNLKEKRISMEPPTATIRARYTVRADETIYSLYLPPILSSNIAYIGGSALIFAYDSIHRGLLIHFNKACNA